MASFVHNNWKGHLGISVSELCFKNALGLLINNRSTFREERIIVGKITATFREDRIIVRKCRMNHRAKRIIICAEQKNRCHENAGRFRWNIVSSEISSESHKKPGILLKFVCITFTQYCSNTVTLFEWMNVLWELCNSRYQAFDILFLVKFYETVAFLIFYVWGDNEPTKKNRDANVV